MLAQSGANLGDGALHEMQLGRGLGHFGQDFFDRHAAAQVDTATQAVFLNLGIHLGTAHRDDPVQAEGQLLVSPSTPLASMQAVSFSLIPSHSDPPATNNLAQHAQVIGPWKCQVLSGSHGVGF